jgi:hypothetical protein
MAATAPRLKLADKIKEQDQTAPASVSAPVAPAKPATVSDLAGARATSTQGSVVAAARRGKKATVGHFSEDMSRTLNALAAMEGTTLQALMGEAWDDLLVKRGKQPFNER